MEDIYVVTSKGITKKHEAIDGIVREISTREELEELIERMPYIQTIQAPNGKARKELYQLAMNEYDDVNWVKVIKSVYLRMADHRYDEFEPNYMERAKNFLYKEIAIRFNLPFGEVENFVNDTIKKHLDEF